MTCDVMSIQSKSGKGISTRTSTLDATESTTIVTLTVELSIVTVTVKALNCTFSQPSSLV